MSRMHASISLLREPRVDNVKQDFQLQSTAISFGWFNQERLQEDFWNPGDTWKTSYRWIPKLYPLGLYQRHFCCQYCSNCQSCLQGQRFFLKDPFPCFTTYCFKTRVCACDSQNLHLLTKLCLQKVEKKVPGIVSFLQKGSDSQNF